MNSDWLDRSQLCDSHCEEVASLLTHAAGVLFSIVALAVMLVQAAGDPLKVVYVAVFGLSVALLYTHPRSIISSPRRDERRGFRNWTTPVFTC